MDLLPDLLFSSWSVVLLRWDFEQILLLAHVLLSCNSLMLTWISGLLAASSFTTRTFLPRKERQSSLAGLVYTLLCSDWVAFRIVSKQSVIVMRRGRYRFLSVSKPRAIFSPLLIVSVNSGIMNAIDWCQNLFNFLSWGRHRWHFYCKLMAYAWV